MRILLVEDNPGDARLVTEMLKKPGEDSEIARFEDLSSTLEGLRRAPPPDVAIIDLSLPDSRGLDTFSAVADALPGIPVIVLTALDDEQTAEAAVRAGAQDYLLKGDCTSDLLKSSIRYAIGRKRVERDLRLALDEANAREREVESLLADSLHAKRLDDAFNSANSAIVSTLDIEEILRRVVVASAPATSADMIGIFQRDETRNWVLRFVHGFPPECLDQAFDDQQVPLVTLCESTRSAAITNDASSDPRANPITRKTLGDARSVLTVPLLVRGTVIGILVFASSWMDVFDDAAMDFAIRLSASVSLALENARLYESERAEAEAIAAINSELCAANDDLKLANIKLENVNTLLDEATNAKSRFLSSMSHELRTPLNSVIGFSKVLLKGMAGPLNAEQERQVRMITESGERLLALINDVLDLSRIEAGGLQLETQRFSVTDSLDSVLMSTRPLADEKGITLRLMKPCCDPYLVSDPTRFQEILLNLVGNAIKFTDEGSVAVEVACPEGWLQMSVSDTGRGIPPEHLDRIFDDFYQVPDKDGAQIVGTGLGLPLSRKLAEALGGSITVRSELGVGSTFTLSLPATDKTPEGKREEVVLPTEAASGEPRSKQKASATQAHSRR